MSLRPRSVRATLTLVAWAAVLAAGACGAPTSPSPAPVSSTSTTGTVAPTSASRTTTLTTATTSATTSSPSATPGGPALAPVPATAPQPAVRFPANDPAVGAGANPVVSGVPDDLWAHMVGYSWTPGCPVGRTQLRLVQVNFWGFDGKRSRGRVVVAASIAGATARALTTLYDQQFRIRQMRPMDSRWGHNPKGPGANDYAAMSADNSSAFNCRYVGGQEASKVYSKHAYGTAVDVNDFENPYVADNGTVYPDDFFLRRHPAPGVFASASSDAVRAFTAQGLRWGGMWAKPDYQHFER